MRAAPSDLTPCSADGDILSVRILFTFTGGEGHLRPLLPLARAAVAAGHEVTVSGAPALRDAAAPLAFTPSGPDVRPQHRELTPVDPQREQAVVRDRFAGTAASARAADLVAICGRLLPDVLVWDEMDFGAAVAAERCGLPHASVVVIAAGGFAERETIGTPLGRLRAVHGLSADPGLEMLRRHLVLDSFPGFRRVGTGLSFGYRSSPAVSAGEELVRPRAAPPLVYATLGTIFNTESGDVFDRVLAGVSKLPIRVVAAVGRGRRPIDLPPQPPSVQVVTWADQERLLEQCAAVVCHGGSGTVTGALVRGVPVVCLPMGADQPANAARCVELGVGVSLDASTATPAEIARAVTTVLDDPGYALAARQLAEANARLPPVEEAVRRIEQIAHPSEALRLRATAAATAPRGCSAQTSSASGSSSS